MEKHLLEKQRKIEKIYFSYLWNSLVRYLKEKKKNKIPEEIRTKGIDVFLKINSILLILLGFFMENKRKKEMESIKWINRTGY